MAGALPTRDDCAALDRADNLARHRAAFALPEEVIYLDGNSLGARPRAVLARVAEVVEAEWGQDLITSWNRHGWIDLPLKVGDKIARLIGAEPGEVAVADSTSINLFKALAAALRMRSGRTVVLSERDNFPTDLYTAEGVIELLGGRHRLHLADAAGLIDAIDGETACVLLTHVNYRTGAMHDMAAITRAARERGAFMLWDLAHSAGAVPVDLNAAGADFAIGCGYKYLNGGPGAPAFIFVPRRHQTEFAQPLTGWLGHAEPFAFGPTFRPAAGIARALCGTPPVLSLAALEVGVDTVLAADLAALRAKSMALGDLFIRLVEEQGGAGFGLRLASPRDAAHRGSQVSFHHAHGYPVMQALIARKVIGDFRAPDLLRFGFAPLYLRYVDIWDAAAALIEILQTGGWDRPEFKRRATVT
ncbi:MAG TPA: kynureninase [Alphaproteobacteria bacterium]